MPVACRVGDYLSYTLRHSLSMPQSPTLSPLMQDLIGNNQYGSDLGGDADAVFAPVACGVNDQLVEDVLAHGRP